MDKNNPDDWLKNLPVQAENIAFKPEEMIGCRNCERANPPNRLNCFYCGDKLIIPEEQKQFLKPKLRKLEAWEKGHNVIYLPNSQFPDEEKVTAAAKLLVVEKETLQKLIGSKVPLPVARAESLGEAEIAKTRLGELGIKTMILSDETLAVEKPPRRLRSVEFFEDKLILVLFNQDEVVEISADNLALIVAGAVFHRRIEATEKYNKKGDNKILNTTETSSDESLIDIYTRQDTQGFRIYAKGFDFSCLETEKQMLAKDNIKNLAEKLRRVAPDAKYIDDYLSNRTFLAGIWEADQKTDSQGLKREGFGKFNLGNVTTVNNLSQFTKYSRLQWHLL